MMKHITRGLLYLFVLLPLTLVGMVVLIVVLPFIEKDAESLPWMVRWFDNHESHYKDQYPEIYPEGSVDGLAGPTYYRKEYGIYPYGDSKGLLLQRWNWLALRNPINYFLYSVLGYVYTPKEVARIVTTGDSDFSHTQGKYGVYTEKHYDSNDDLLAWEVFALVKISERIAIRYRAGYKLSSIDDRSKPDTFQWTWSPGIRIKPSSEAV